MGFEPGTFELKLNASTDMASKPVDIQLRNRDAVFRKFEEKQEQTINNETYKAQLEVKPIENTMTERQLERLGHIHRISEGNITRKFFEVISEGRNKEVLVTDSPRSSRAKRHIIGKFYRVCAEDKNLEEEI